jgi:hypothetical protein
MNLFKWNDGYRKTIHLEMTDRGCTIYNSVDSTFRIIKLDAKMEAAFGISLCKWICYICGFCEVTK